MKKYPGDVLLLKSIGVHARSRECDTPPGMKTSHMFRSLVQNGTLVAIEATPTDSVISLAIRSQKGGWSQQVALAFEIYHAQSKPDEPHRQAN